MEDLPDELLLKIALWNEEALEERARHWAKFARVIEELKTAQKEISKGRQEFTGSFIKNFYNSIRFSYLWAKIVKLDDDEFSFDDEFLYDDSEFYYYLEDERAIEGSGVDKYNDPKKMNIAISSLPHIKEAREYYAFEWVFPPPWVLNPNGQGSKRQVYKRFFDEIGNPSEGYILKHFDRLNNEFNLFANWEMDEDDFYEALLELGYIKPADPKNANGSIKQVLFSRAVKDYIFS